MADLSKKGGIGGSGTADTVTKWTDTTEIGDSIITDNGATVTVGGGLSVDGAFNVGSLVGTIETVSTSSNIHNYALGADTTTLIVDIGASVQFTGMQGGVHGRRVRVYFISSLSVAITTVNESASSTAENRLVGSPGVQGGVSGTGHVSMDCEYDGAISRWRCQALRWLTQSSAYTFSSTLTANGSTTLGDSATDLVTVNGRILATINSGTPSESVIEARSNGSSGGFISLVPMAVDTNYIMFDGNRSGSNYVAQDTSAAGVGKTGDKLMFIGVNGVTDSLSMNTEWSNAVSTPMGYFDLTDGALYLSQSSTLIGRQIFTASGTYTPTSGTRKVRIRVQGAGGAGGGTTGAGSGCAAGGGGAGGGYLEVYIAPGAAVTGGAVTVGAGGTGASAAVGGNGGDSSIVIQGTTYTAKGGQGGAAGANTTTQARASGGLVGSSTSSGGNIISRTGQTGEAGMILLGSSAIGGSGRGGAAALGDGGGSVSGQSAGATATLGYGGGGSGSFSTTTNQAGGNGSPGIVIVEEYR